jgi:hypothetical protein
MRRVTGQAHGLHATGVVGVTIDRSQTEREREVNNTRYTDLIIELHVVGTAIVEVGRAGGPVDPALVLPLN